MKNKMKRLLSLLLCVTLLQGAVLCAYADSDVSGNQDANQSEDGEKEELPEPNLVINTVKEFLDFSEKCRLDTYSRDLVVALESDLDLTGLSFQGIPTFGGIFLGNGHKISGLKMDGEGSVKGLFRYIQSGGMVRDLTVEGAIAPKGSRSYVGGIAGHNAGVIKNCTFFGNISGSERIGGMVGYNGVTGVIENCKVDGHMHGDHFVGGIAGENTGVIRGSENDMSINTTVVENSVEISDITLDTLLNSESVATITDVGGIAGTNRGVIRSCINYGNVGYRQIGYNIGGIAGSQIGYIVDCENYAQVQGRKEVGGIVGQMEPATQLKFDKDTLQILQEDLGVMADLTDKAAGDMQDSSDMLSGQMADMNSDAEKASEAIDVLLKDLQGEEVDPDTLIAAKNNLSGSLSSMSGTAEEMLNTGEQSTATMTGNMEAIADQIRVISNSIGNAADGFGAEVKDVSDEDTPEDVTGKLNNCKNYGDLLADLTVGGIVGSIAMESDLDLEADVDIVGETSLNSEIRLRAVIISCENKGRVECKKQYAGGIAGQIALGLIKECANTGDVMGQTADYVGGIAGSSVGYVRSCYVKCRVNGSTYVGGILGTGKILTDSRSMVMVSGIEKVGHIVGFAELNEEIAANYYFCISEDAGGIDGISYKGVACAMTREEFFAGEETKELFATVNITFVRKNGEVLVQSYDTGTVLIRNMIPEIIQQDGYVGTWQKLEDYVGTELLFDYVFYEAYTPYKSVLQSDETRDNGLAMLLIEGTFLPEYKLQLHPSIVTPNLLRGQSILEAYTFSLPENEKGHTFRFLPSVTEADGTLCFMVYNKNGTWREADWEKEGSYYVFHVESGETAFCVLECEQKNPLWIWIGCGTVGILLLAGGGLWLKKRKKHRKKEV